MVVSVGTIYLSARSVAVRDVRTEIAGISSLILVMVCAIPVIKVTRGHLYDT